VTKLKSRQEGKQRRVEDAKMRAGEKNKVKGYLTQRRRGAKESKFIINGYLGRMDRMRIKIFIDIWI